MQKLKKSGFPNALGVLIYVSIVVTVMNNGDRIFGEMDNYVGPIAFLLLFVISAATVGGLVIGQPIMLYLENKKKEAIELFLLVMAWLVLFTALALVVSILL